MANITDTKSYKPHFRKFKIMTVLCVCVCIYIYMKFFYILKYI